MIILIIIGIIIEIEEEGSMHCFGELTRRNRIIAFHGRRTSKNSVSV
jgi:hypothetical protein